MFVVKRTSSPRRTHRTVGPGSRRSLSRHRRSKHRRRDGRGSCRRIQLTRRLRSTRCSSVPPIVRAERAEEGGGDDVSVTVRCLQRSRHVSTIDPCEALGTQARQVRNPCGGVDVALVIVVGGVLHPCTFRLISLAHRMQMIPCGGSGHTNPQGANSPTVRQSSRSNVSAPRVHSQHSLFIVVPPADTPSTLPAPTGPEVPSTPHSGGSAGRWAQCTGEGT